MVLFHKCRSMPITAKVCGGGLNGGEPCAWMVGCIGGGRITGTLFERCIFHRREQTSEPEI